MKSNETDDIYALNVTKTVVVYRHASGLSVDATPSVVVGKNTTITVTMKNNETGKVVITVNGLSYLVNITNDHKAVLDVALPVGKYNATVRYLGDAKYNETSNKTVAEFSVPFYRSFARHRSNLF